ncbi:MAG: hypothetical protein RIR19_84 [Chloroflexota bacterium]
MAQRLFSLEGREAPALHLIGLVGSLLGASLSVAGVAGGGPILLIVGVTMLTVGLTSLAGASALQRHVDTPQTGWRGPGPVLIFFVTLGWAAVAGALIGLVLNLVDPAAAIDASLLTLLFALATSVTSTAAIALLVVGTGAARWRDLFAFSSSAGAIEGALPPAQRRGGWIADVAWGLALLVPSVVTAIVASGLLTHFTGVSPNAPLPPVNIEPGGPAGFGFEVRLALNLVTAVIVAPLGEELLYRGVIARAWGRQSGARRAIVFSTLIFAFAHTIGVGGDTAGEALTAAGIALLVRIPLGLATGWLWVRRRSLLAPIVLHASYNLLVVLIANVATS